MVDTTHLIQYKLFEPFKNLLAFTTTKNGFSDRSPRFTGDVPETYQSSRVQLSEQLGISVKNLVFPRQTHTNCVVELDDIPQKEIKQTDALISNKPGICLCVQTADCVPVLLFDPKNNVVAAVHAGWRGTVQKIVEITVQKMKDDYQTKAEDVLAVVGPSIGPEVYEVGPEVVGAAKKSIPKADKTLALNSKGKYHFNLWEANRQLLLQSGLAEKNIEILGECSFQNQNKYFSARRDGVETGRMVSGIMLTDSSKNS